MNPVSVPETIINRFRTLSLDRLTRVESVWNTLLQGNHDEETVRGASRDLHTLKGDAGIIGFTDVHTLAHKLEELFALAGQLQYRVSQELRDVVVLTLEAVRNVLRNTSDTATGDDLQSLIQQIDRVLHEARELP